MSRKTKEPVFVLGIQAQFEKPVERGQKTTTIRLERKDGRRPRVGQLLRFYVNMRQPTCRMVAEGRCTEVLDVVIDGAGGRFYVRVGSQVLSGDELAALAKGEGFADSIAMHGWFAKHHRIADEIFEGFLTRWVLDGASVHRHKTDKLEKHMHDVRERRRAAARKRLEGQNVKFTTDGKVFVIRCRRDVIDYIPGNSFWRVRGRKMSGRGTASLEKAMKKLRAKPAQRRN